MENSNDSYQHFIENNGLQKISNKLTHHVPLLLSNTHFKTKLHKNHLKSKRIAKNKEHTSPSLKFTRTHLINLWQQLHSKMQILHAPKS